MAKSNKKRKLASEKSYPNQVQLLIGAICKKFEIEDPTILESTKKFQTAVERFLGRDICTISYIDSQGQVVLLDDTNFRSIEYFLFLVELKELPKPNKVTESVSKLKELLAEFFQELSIRRFAPYSNDYFLKINNDLLRDDTKILETMSGSDLTAIELGADGNCMFYCLSHQLFQTKDHAQELRCLAASLIYQYRKFYEPFVDGMNFRDYCYQMNAGKLWGDNLVLQVIADYFQCEMLILETAFTQQVTHVIPSIGHPQTTIMLAHLGEVHYMSVLPKEVKKEYDVVNLWVRNKDTPLAWQMVIKEAKGGDKQLKYLQDLSISYILDVEMFTSCPHTSGKHNKLAKLASPNLQVEFEQFIKNKNVDLPSSLKLPSSLQNGSIPNLFREHFYILECTYHYRNTQPKHERSQLGLTGAVLAHIYDAFWTTYCADLDDITIIWRRDQDLMKFLSGFPADWSVFPDGFVQVKFTTNTTVATTYYEIMAVFEDKATSPQIADHRGKLAEECRYIHDTIRSHHPILTADELKQIKIPGICTAGQVAELYVLVWSGIEQNCYIFQKLATFDFDEFQQYINCCKSMFWMLQVIKENMAIIQTAYNTRGAFHKEHHSYVLRSHRAGQPASGPNPESGSHATNTPRKSRNPHMTSLAQKLAAKGYNNVQAIHTGKLSTVFLCLPDRKQVIKVTSNKDEMEVLQRMSGRHHVIQLLDHFQISEQHIALLLPFVENIRITSANQLFTFATQLIDGMVHLHECGICHRDLKTQNVLFDGHQVFIIDFNVASLISTNKQHHSHVGTKGYMAPEVALNMPSNISSDTWSAGITLLEKLLEWKDGYLAAHVIQQRSVDDLLRMAQCICRQEGLESLADLLKKMLVKDPQQRITDAEITQHPYLAPYFRTT